MSMTRTAAVLAGLALPLALVAGGCGNGDDDKASQAISDSLMKQRSGGLASILSLSRKDADCVGDGFVDKIGTDRLQKAGLLTKDLKTEKSPSIKMSAGDAKTASTVLFSCTDVKKGVTETIASSDQTKNLPSSVKTCISKALTARNLRPIFTAAFQGEQGEVQKTLLPALSRCAVGNAG